LRALALDAVEGRVGELRLRLERRRLHQADEFDLVFPAGHEPPPVVPADTHDTSAGRAAARVSLDPGTSESYSGLATSPLDPGRLEAMATPIVKQPIYQQINGALRELVASGQFKTGARFLTEREISERFEVSRVTANKAISNLVSEGILE